jgi:hypothetical protein
MPGARARTRSLACKNKKHTSKSPQVEPANRHSLRDGFSGFLRALPGDRAFLSPSQAAMRKHLSRLDVSVETSGPHDFAVRLGRLRLMRPRRPSHPALNVRDDRETPLWRSAGRAEFWI